MNPTGIQFRLLLLGVIPALFLVTSLAYYFIQHQYLDLGNALKEKGQVMSKQLAISSIYGVFSENTIVLNEITQGLMNDSDIASIHITNKRGDFLAQSKQSIMPPTQEQISFQHPVIIHSLDPKMDDEALDFYNKPTKVLPTKVIGMVNVTLSLKNTRKKQSSYLLDSLFIIFTGLILSILLAIRLSKTISRPIINLTKAANALTHGKMETRAKESHIAEIDLLCKSFNSMATGLQDEQNNLINQVNFTVKELNTTLARLEEKNLSLEKSTQQAINQNKTKSQFIAHISHEIRTPMNGILGFIDLLSRSKLTLQQLDQAQLIKSSASNLLSIVNEILDFSSLETGKFKLTFSNFNIREKIENCVTSILPSSNKVQLIINIDHDVPEIAFSDPLRLQQLITNLLGNACKFTYQGHIIVHCRLIKNNNLFISISDSGTGIPKNKTKILFQPFLQVSEYAVSNELGTGLGLTICKNIINRFGGKIGVCTQPNVGSTFWFHLPIKLSSSEQKKPFHYTVLVIDSFNLRRNAFVKQLSHLGLRVTSVASISKHCLEKNSQFDLIFYAKHSPLPLNNTPIQNQLRLLSIKGKIILIDSHQNTSADEETLPLPCRSSYLIDFISHSLSTNTPQPIAMLPLQATENTDSISSILIADDNEINRLLLKSQLEIYCKNITLAGDGKKALQCLQKQQYHLVFLDLQMPYFSGLELIKIIKQPLSINKDTPIIAITAHAQSHQRRTLIKSGFDECLIKPVLLEQISEIIDLWLPKKEDSPKQNTDYVSILLEKTSGNIELTSSIFNKLFKELEEHPQAIEQALEKADYTLAEQITHKLHGSVCFCGFKDLQKSAEKMEISLTEKDIPQIQSNFKSLKKDIMVFLGVRLSIEKQLKQKNL